MHIYVMSSILGNYDLLMRMMEQIDFNSSDKIVLLGNNIDINRNNQEIINWIYSNYEQLVLLRGNIEHEIINNQELFDLNIDLIEEYHELVKGMEYVYKVNINNSDYYFAHAGVTMRHHISKKYKTRQDFNVYAMDEAFYYSGIKDSTVILGHIPTDYKSSIFCNDNKISHVYNDRFNTNYYDVNCGKVNNTMRLGCLEIIEMKEYYI